jgi:hypothetical protein
MTPAGQPTSGSDPPPQPGPILTQPARRDLHCQPQKGLELANLPGDTLDQVIAAADRGVHRVRGTPHLPYSFLRHCGLSLW